MNPSLHLNYSRFGILWNSFLLFLMGKITAGLVGNEDREMKMLKLFEDFINPILMMKISIKNSLLIFTMSTVGIFGANVLNSEIAFAVNHASSPQSSNSESLADLRRPIDLATDLLVSRSQAGFDRGAVTSRSNQLWSPFGDGTLIRAFSSPPISSGPISTFAHPGVLTSWSNFSGTLLSIPTPSPSDIPFESHREGYKNLEFLVSQVEYIQQYFETEKTRLQTRVNKSYISSRRFDLEEDFFTATAVIDH